ncbi:D-alanine--D-alanine ligase family protein [Tessaracoccus antarcticus]|uniref:D-alanine--D-alanine ligase n=1 Tax=Tessaracoccus antarcticus TaxID=2479848 RepID=A0A3M0G2E0_9ACTN|nr:D-alanine--D-alanine ligase family protein [Tessaracoccus antarcticus]RMB58935.1 D-alanine--D-alanine ligase [Tessaracoccus antarcticus]
MEETTAEQARIRVALIFGGQSPEHGVSCLTAASVLKAVDQERFDVVAVGITREGRWTQVPLDVVADYSVINGRVPEVAGGEYDAVWMVGASGCEVASRNGAELLDIRGVDVAFALLHGPYGEDGTIQGLFEMMGIRYVGSGVAASAIGMDKHHMKVAFEAAGLPVWPYVVATAQQWLDHPDRVLAEVSALQYPVFVKPSRGGSSLGITRVTDPAQLPAAIAAAQAHDPKVIIEQGFVGARELECAVLANPQVDGGCDASVVGEVRVLAKDGFYDFEAKYIADDQAALDIPADISHELSREIQIVAKRAFNAVGAEGLARVDVFAAADGGVWINEINTMPGFTEISMYPKLVQHSGMTYPDLVGRLIELALLRPVGLR